MSLILDGTNGLSDVDGSAGTPAIRGSDTNTGIFFDADIIGFSEGGTECARFNADAQFVAAAGTASLPVITTTGDVNTGIFFPAADTIAFAEGGAEAMRIDSSGNLLVGVTSNTYNYIRKSNTGNYVVGVENLANTSGDANYRSKLGSNCNNTSSYHLTCDINGTDKMYIQGNGNLINVNNSYGTLSDIKLKENIVNATPKLNEILQLQVRNFNLKSDPNLKQIGFIAQEFEQVFPAMVDETQDRAEDGSMLDTYTKSIKTSVLVPILVKAIQEQQALIESLTARVVALEGQA